jgi:hypothetical protein
MPIIHEMFLSILFVTHVVTGDNGPQCTNLCFNSDFVASDEGNRTPSSRSCLL